MGTFLAHYEPLLFIARRGASPYVTANILKLSVDKCNLIVYNQIAHFLIRGRIMEKKYESLKLENQLCFPLYACSKEVVKKYKPFLDELDLTYTQYITMMVLWDKKSVNVKELGEELFLDSGTLTPLLKKLEAKGYLSRERSKNDERNLVVTITNKGEELKEKAVEVPFKMGQCVRLTKDEASELYRLLHKLLDNM